MGAELVAAEGRPRREFPELPVAPVHTDTPVKEAMLLFYQHDGDIPVVERKTNRLLGIVTPWEILDALR